MLAQSQCCGAIFFCATGASAGAAKKNTTPAPDR